MTSIDTFYTIEHRGAHIHGYFDRSLDQEVITTTLTGNRKYGSVTDAKRAISSRIAAARMKSTGPKSWTYRGVDVHPAAINSSGIRWYALTDNGTLRADSKETMRFAIREN